MLVRSLEATFFFLILRHECIRRNEISGIQLQGQSRFENEIEVEKRAPMLVENPDTLLQYNNISTWRLKNTLCYIADTESITPSSFAGNVNEIASWDNVTFSLTAMDQANTFQRRSTPKYLHKNSDLASRSAVIQSIQLSEQSFSQSAQFNLSEHLFKQSTSHTTVVQSFNYSSQCLSSTIFFEVHPFEVTLHWEFLNNQPISNQFN